MLTAFSMDYLKQITVISHIVEQLISILVTQSSFCIEILLKRQTGNVNLGHPGFKQKT